MLRTFTTELNGADFDVCVVGAGPVGLALAFGCEEHGLSVLLLEAGGASIPATQEGSVGHVVDPAHHAPDHLVTCSALGGASRLWGGRCVPLDDVDFEARAHVDAAAAWPMPHAELARYYPVAAAFFGVGDADFSVPEACENFSQSLERWTPEPDLARLYRRRIEASQKIQLVLDVTALRIEFDDAGAVAGLVLGGEGREHRIAPQRLALACGGLQTARLLLASQSSAPLAFGGPDGALGRYYMGHLSGKIADIVFQDQASVRAHGFKKIDGVYLRRRFTLPSAVQIRERVFNTAFLVDNLALNDDHQNEALSLIWLVLSTRRVVRKMLRLEREPQPRLGSVRLHWRRHMLNVLRAPAASIVGGLRIFRTRVGARLFTPSMWMRADDIWRRRGPELLIGARARRYALHYHAEQSPDRASCVSLANSADARGAPRLKIDFKFHLRDALSVVRAHELLDEGLRRAGVGELRFHRETTDERAADVMRQALDGYHQIGLTRMGDDPATSVVDKDCKAHGVDNLFVVSTAVFPTSGQANPTFPAVALAFRLADRIAAESCAETIRSPRRSAPSAGLGDAGLQSCG